MMISLDFEEWLRIDAVVKCAKTLVAFETPNPQGDLTDRQRLAQCRLALRDLSVAVQLLERNSPK